MPLSNFLMSKTRLTESEALKNRIIHPYGTDFFFWKTSDGMRRVGGGGCLASSAVEFKHIIIWIICKPRRPARLLTHPSVLDGGIPMIKAIPLFHPFAFDSFRFSVIHIFHICIFSCSAGAFHKPLKRLLNPLQFGFKLTKFSPCAKKMLAIYYTVSFSGRRLPFHP